jgi:hypothetical protein
MKTIFAFSIAVTWKQHFFAEIPVWTYWPGELMVAPARDLRDYTLPTSAIRKSVRAPKLVDNQRIRGDTPGSARTVPVVPDPTSFATTTPTLCLDVACLPSGCLELNVSS